jgi:hypothetical protein
MAFDHNTLLILDAIGVPLYSARGLKQTLSFIDSAKQLRRTINGVMVDLSRPQFRLYKSTITCTDIEAPAFDGLTVGTLVQVSCVCELVYPSAGTANRTAVSGSERTIGNFISYRPVLNMIVTDFQQGFAEWPHDNDWTLDLEEVAAT